MKKNIHKNIFEMLKSKGVLAVSTALLMISCGVQTGAYSETDGIYYDPNRDTLPEGYRGYNAGNQVGSYYDYQNSDYIPTQQEIVYDRYKDWNGQTSSQNVTSSDWGAYTGSEVNYYDSGWYNPYGMYGGFGWGIGFGFGSPWGWYGGYNPYWGYGGWGSPWGYYGGFGSWYGYNPYWYGMGYGYPYWGNGYYGNGYYGNGYYGNHNSYNPPRLLNTRSGSVGTFGRSNSRLNSGFRNSTPYPNNTGGFRRGSDNSMNNNTYNNQGNMGTGRYRTAPQPRYNNNNDGNRSSFPNNPQPTYRNDNNGGFRSSGSGNTGGFRSGSTGGGFNSGSSGTRSGGGGFRR